ncbi:Zinc finger MYND-type [Penicillium argentinense]|uniref:Zinc finger MYND-type n=1 Tax=Penicillium argentinense TaxID=1131581 RepID=A0A9W9G6S8_9EURO|nr:Zinc finger MYND-type [Penicillium argentinense]KAJ5112417.1 Zinc finger MYND-type [Penicillium argentinense]
MSVRNPLPSVTTRTVARPSQNGMGNGLFATADIKMGEDVLHAKVPFVAVLDSSRLDDTCSACFGKRQMDFGTELKACTGCRVVRYCDRTCQSKDWRFAHSTECSIFQKVKPNVLPNNARAILRMVVRTSKGKYNSQELETFSQLETHINEIQELQAHLDRIMLTSRAVKNYSETEMTEETIMTYAAKLDLNSFNLTTALYDRIGLYMHPYAALINHSCDFNSTVGFDGEELFVKAIRPIKKNEQIFISYIDTTTPKEVRCKELSERYFFDCKCPKCEKGTDTPEDRFEDTSKDKSVLDEAERKALELMQSAQSSNASPDETIEKLEKALHTLKQSSAWPLTRQPYASIRDDLIVSLLAANSFTRAFIQAAIRYLRIDPILYSPTHPIRHIHAWILAKLAIYLSQGYEPDPKDPIQLQDFEINYHYILWYILADLASRQMESCTVPGFKKLVGANFQQVHTEFKSNGIDPSTAKPLVNVEWRKLERLVQTALDKE